MAIEAFAPAKINLTLHVTGQRTDGYHLLDSLVAFADIGDRVLVRPGDALSLAVTGPEAAALSAEDDNLVMRAARLFDEQSGAQIELIKNLPLASGIGGGSADAAATLKALAELWNRPLPAAQQILSLGADVPVCMRGYPARMRGIGEDVQAVPRLPEDMGMVLINPRVLVSTPAVFNGLTHKVNAPMPADIPTFSNAREFSDWLARQRNDLQAAAIAQVPVIADVLEVLNSEDPLLARMSGSGATCFALYATEHEAKATGGLLAERHPDWWVQWARLGPQVPLS